MQSEALHKLKDYFCIVGATGDKRRSDLELDPEEAVDSAAQALKLTIDNEERAWIAAGVMIKSCG